MNVLKIIEALKFDYFRSKYIFTTSLYDMATLATAPPYVCVVTNTTKATSITYVAYQEDFKLYIIKVKLSEFVLA